MQTIYIHNIFYLLKGQIKMSKKSLFPLSITVVIIILLSGCIDLPTTDQNNKVEIQGRNGYYDTINQAIENATEGDTVIVYPGCYQETLTIDKSLTLKGVKKETTIIDGNFEGDVIHVTADNVNINSLTIKNAGNVSYADAGIDIASSNNSIVNSIILNCGYYAVNLGTNSNNNIIQFNNISNNIWGLYLSYSSGNNISNNVILNNSEYSMYLASQSSDNEIFNNEFSENNYAIRIKSSNDNKVIRNIFADNERGVYFCCGSRNNIVHHCNFYNSNDYHGRDYLDNYWDDGSQGNYWDDYQGLDEDGDCIGDTPYKIGEVYDEPDIFDNYPLMFPI